MAITARSLDQALWTMCYETSTNGRRRQLPWAFVNLGTEGDARYIVPVQGLVARGTGGDGRLPTVDGVAETAPEFMPNQPFPVGAPLHYFGGV